MGFHVKLASSTSHGQLQFRRHLNIAMVIVSTMGVAGNSSGHRQFYIAMALVVGSIVDTLSRCEDAMGTSMLRHRHLAKSYVNMHVLTSTYRPCL